MQFKKIIFIALAFQAIITAKEYTLTDLATLATHYKGNIAPDNTDPYNPDFSSYFSSLRPSLFRRMTNFMGITHDPFPMEYCLQLLKEVIEQQKKRGRAGDYIAATQLVMENKIYTFGSLQGAFHSLVRDLQELKKQNVIDEQLRIIDPQAMIIFNGPVLCRSAEPLQTIFIILLLLKQNPERVIYLENDFQRSGLWKNYGFIQHVNAVYKEYLPQMISLFEEFTKTLPLAFYGNYEKAPEKLLKFVAVKEFFTEGIEQETGDFFYQLKNDEIHTWPLKKKEKTPKPTHVRVLFSGLVPEIENQALRPLTMLESEKMAVVWRVFSSPTYAFQKLFNFNDDAFGCLVCGKELSSSVIELYVRNAASQEPFMLKESYRLKTGVPVKATRENLMVHKNKITLAAMLDLSAVNYVMGRAIRRGIAFAQRQINQLDILPGKEVLTFVYEDFYVPHIAQENYEMLKAEGVDAFLLSIGTTPLLVSRRDLEQGTTLQAFPVSASPEYRLPNMKGVVNFVPRYDRELSVLLDFLVKNYHLKTFGFFYQDDEYGREMFKKAQEILQALGVDTCIAIPHVPDEIDFKKQCDLVKAHKVQALGLLSESLITQRFLKQLGAYALSTTQLFARSFVADEVFEQFVKKELGLSCIYSRVVPDPARSSLPIVQEYRALLDEAGYPYDSFSLLGFICTSILCDIMKKVEGPITHQALIAELEKLNNYDYKGLTLTFDPANRQISDRVWLDLQDGSEWREVPR